MTMILKGSPILSVKWVRFIKMQDVDRQTRRGRIEHVKIKECLVWKPRELHITLNSYLMD